MPDHLHLITLLEKMKSGLLSANVTCLKSSADYSLLFFSRVVDHLKKKKAVSIQAVDLQHNDKQQVIGQLETAFLGATTCYWLKDLSVLPIKEQAFWYEYCTHYKGPNQLLFFTQKDKVKHTYCSAVELPAAVDERLIMQLAAFFDVKLSPSNRLFMTKLFAGQSKGIPFDTAYLMLEYMQLIGADSNQFFAQILHKIMPVESSLFVLSSAFMAKKSTAFFTQWRQLYLSYSEQFWCSFFSDLVWRSAEYVRLAHNNDMIGARKVAYRLPFSFIKSDWRKLTHKELTAAHAFIYDADSRFKNGGGYAAFDLFFSSFFLNSFDK